jgi:phage/plasmid primase-like uncharacterized protein
MLRRQRDTAMAVQALREARSLLAERARRIEATAPSLAPKRANSEKPAPAPQRPQRTVAAPPSPTQALADFADALRDSGLLLKGGPVMDGRWHRVPTVDDKAGRRSGSYRGFLDGWPSGSIRNHRSGVTVPWRAGADERAVADPAAVEAARRQVKEAAAVRAAARAVREEQVARRAAALWAGYPEATADHAYLQRKGVGAHGLKLDRRGNALVPMRDADGKLWSLQRIKPQRGSYGADKPYLKGGRVSGMFAMLGDPASPGPIFIAEGYATAATVHEATGRPVAVAFTSNNLLAVAQALRAREPGRALIVAADNDHHLPRRPVPLANVGLEKGAAAAEAVGGLSVAPIFEDGNPGTDWNDFAKGRDAAAVRDAIRRGLVQARQAATKDRDEGQGR